MLAGSVTSSAYARTSPGRAADLGGDRPPEVDAPAGERDLRALPGEHAREVPAEAAERAGDESGAAFERLLVHRRLRHATPR
jgi:hypothetical protein